jgi:hypothetical protein
MIDWTTRTPEVATQGNIRDQSFNQVRLKFEQGSHNSFRLWIAGLEKQ